MNEKLTKLKSYFSVGGFDQKELPIIIKNITKDDLNEALTLLRISKIPKATCREWGNPCYLALYDQNHIDTTFAIVSGKDLFIVDFTTLIASDVVHVAENDWSSVTNTISGGVYGGFLGAVFANAISKPSIYCNDYSFVFKVNDEKYKAGETIRFQIAKNEYMERIPFQKMLNQLTNFYNEYCKIISPTCGEIIGKSSKNIMNILNDDGSIDKGKIEALSFVLLKKTANSPYYDSSKDPKRHYQKLPFPERGV